MTARVAIVGAGSSGIATGKVFTDRGISFDCFEAGDRVGGNWVHHNSNGMSSCYRGLCINTSRTRMEYPDLAMPADDPDFPHHSHIARYFDEYVDRGGFRDRIRFRTRVERVTPKDGRFEVTTKDDAGRTTTTSYEAVVVANGHHWDPRFPEPAFPGTFSGETLHSHHYDTPDFMKGKRVLVLGMGNSAMDIAVEASYVAERTVLTSRRGAWVIPKYIFGRPLDTILVDGRVPFRVRRRIGEALVLASVGRMSRYGLPEPDHRMGSAHPTISGRILDRLGHGAIEYRPNIERLDGDHVLFVDGRREPFDVLVYCTGYKVTFPFFDEAFLAAKDNDLPLYRRVFHPDVPNLFFVGLLQPLGAIMPLAHAQSRWIAELLGGGYTLPPAADMRRDMVAEREEMFARYVASPRHTMQVDYDDYLLALEKELVAGRKRARRAAG